MYVDTKLNNRAKLHKYGNSGLHFKGHFHTLLGFVFGFLMALATLLFYDRFLLLSEQLERHTTATEYYQTGYMEALQEVAAKDDTLRQRLSVEVRVLCMVLTAPKYHESRAAHVRATWGKRCTKLIFVSSVLDEQLGAVGVVEAAADTYDALWNKTREGFRYVYEEHFKDYDWFLKADDDTYIIMENLRFMLYRYHSDTPIYFGYKMIAKTVEYMSGGAAYVLSKEALRRFVSESLNNDTLCPVPDLGKPEDFCMAICLQNVGVYLGESRYASAVDNRTKFLPLDLLAYMNPDYNITDWVFERTPYRIETGLNCCSNYSIGFHYTPPSHMYLYEYFIYHLQAVGGQRHSLKLPSKLTTFEVAQLFPRSLNDTIISIENFQIIFRDKYTKNISSNYNLSEK